MHITQTSKKKVTLNYSHMKVQIKNSSYSPKEIKPLFNFLESISHASLWDFNGLSVEIDPCFDFKNNDVLVRWTDIEEGFNDKIIVNSLDEFNSNFKLINA